MRKNCSSCPLIWVAILIGAKGVFHCGVAGSNIFSTDVPLHAEKLTCLTVIQLEDQFDKAHAYNFPRDSWVVLLVADKDGFNLLGDWIEELRKARHDQWTLVGIADVRGVPRLFRSRVKKGFRAKQDHPVLMDWDGSVLGLLKPVEGMPNVYLVDPTGQVVKHVSGKATPKNLHDLGAYLEVKGEDPSTEPEGRRSLSRKPR